LQHKPPFPVPLGHRVRNSYRHSKTNTVTHRHRPFRHSNYYPLEK